MCDEYGEYVNDQQFDNLYTELHRRDIDVPKFLLYINVRNLGEVNKSEYNRVIGLMQMKPLKGK